jgi:hypothetical protein
VHRLGGEHDHGLRDLYRLAKPGAEDGHGHVAPEGRRLLPMPIVNIETLDVQWDFERIWVNMLTPKPLRGRAEK